MGDLTTVKAKAKSFWDTKEGTTGMVIGLGVFGFLGYAAYKLMPFIANLMENTFYAIAFGVASVALFYITVIDDTLRTRGWLAYKMMMRALTYSIISYDPVGVLRELSKKAWDRINEINESRAKVNGQVKQIQAAVDDFNKQLKDLTGQAQMYQKQGDIEHARAKAAQLARLKEAIDRLTVSYDRTKGFYTQLTRAYNAATQIRENLDFEIGIREKEYKATTAARDAWKLVHEALKGGSEFDNMEQETLAWMAEDYGNKLGQIDSFMEDSTKYIDNVDISNAMYAQDGLKFLDDLNNRNLDVIEVKATEVKATPNLQYAPSPTIPTTVGSNVVDYSSLRKKG